MTAADLVRDQLEQVDRDLEEVAGQVEAGELDEETADELRRTYRRERSELVERLTALDATDATPASGRDRRRVVWGTVLILVAFAAVTVVLLNTVQQRQPGELATGGVATDVITGNVNLADITNEEMEAVVAENPEIVPMRLALANRYFEAGEFDRALPHFMTVLDQEQDNPEALASVGWMTYLSGRADVGETFVERALAAAPEYAQAYWFLGNIRLYGLEDAAGAISPFERLLEFEGVPEEIRTQAEESLAEARS